MDIVKEVFDRRTLRTDKLVAYGFTPYVGGFSYTTTILNGQFRVEVAVSERLIPSARVVDAFTEEEYAPVNVEMSTGAFVGSVRAAYRAALTAIAEACSVREYFSSGQANRLAEAVYARYGERPDFPFATAPTYGVFRYPVNRKWYGIVMDVRRCLVTKESTPCGEESPTVDVLNLKIDPSRRAELLAMAGFYICYHMNKEGWISVVLDDTVADEEILALLNDSRNFVLPKKKRGTQ